MAVAGTTACLPVREDAEGLLKRVLGSGAVPDRQVLSLAWHPPGVYLRPVEALHLLSLVTAHSYSAGDLHDAYAWWGLLRYLGFFDHEASEPHPALRISRAGAQVAGVQPRVASEELGIAFGVLLASMHIRKVLDPGARLAIVDVDVLLRGSGSGSSGRADYVLVAGSDEAESGSRVWFLECKGTSDPRHCAQQLAKAVEQLAEPVLGYTVHAGLAVSTVTGASQVSCVALSLTDSSAGGPVDSEPGPRRSMRDDPAQGMLPRLADTLVPAALRASWSMLGHYAGNEIAVRRWSDRSSKPYDASSQARQQRRVRFESEYGPAVGVTDAFRLGDQQLVVTWGIDQQVDNALTNGGFQDVLAAQEAFARELDEISARDRDDEEPEASGDSLVSEEQLTSGEPTISAMPDGSVFSLTINQPVRDDKHKQEPEHPARGE
jgi:hypothetical protein